MHGISRWAAEHGRTSSGAHCAAFEFCRTAAANSVAVDMDFVG